MKTWICLFVLFLIHFGRLQGQFDISNAINKFTIDVLRTTAKEIDKSKNLVMAPFTIWTILSNINEGASGGTQSQIEAALNIQSVDRDAFHQNLQNLTKILTKSGYGIEMEMKNALFATQTEKLRAEFAQISQKVYDIDVTPVDFSKSAEAVSKINSLISKATKERLQNYMQPNEVADAKMFAVSVLYFKGSWQTPFNRSASRSEPFRDERGGFMKNVNMMHITGFFAYAQLPSIQAVAVELPYGEGDRFSMVFVLPTRGTVNDVLNAMSNQPFSTFLDSLDTNKQDFEGEDVEIALPSFKMQSNINLNKILHTLGVQDVFNSAKADLLGIFPNNYLFISRMTQSVQIEVNEEGTVATAVAAAVFQNKSPPPRFIANKPFLFFIVNKETGTILFSGKIMQPNIVS